MEKVGTAGRILKNKNYFMLWCKSCKKKQSVVHASFLYNTHLKIDTFVDFSRFWLCKTDRMAMAGMLS